MDHINAKIKAKRAKLITAEQYQILCRSQSTEHFFTQLQMHPAYTHGRISMAEEMDRMRLFWAGSGASSGIGSVAAAGWRLFIALEEDYIQAWSYIKTLPNGPNRQALTYIKGTEIDLHNILCIYRLKRYYPQAEVYPHLVPVCYRLNKEALRQMAESPGIAEFIVNIGHTHYGNVFGSFEDPEWDASRAMRLAFAKTAKRYPLSMAGVLGYFFDKRIELHNLIAVMEGVKYRLAPDEIFKYLSL